MNSDQAAISLLEVQHIFSFGLPLNLPVTGFADPPCYSQRCSFNTFNKQLLALGHFFHWKKLGHIALLFPRTSHLFKHLALIWGKSSDNSAVKLTVRKGPSG